MSTSIEVPPSRAEAMRKLATDAMTCEALGALAHGGVHCILLKGMTLQDRLYGADHIRRYFDADLFVAPTELAKARAILTRIGFRLRFDTVSQPFRIPNPHSEDWRRGLDAIDLHWRLPGVEADDVLAWQVLAGLTETAMVGAMPVTKLNEEATALLLALHAARHGTSLAKPLTDLSRGIERIAA